MAPLEFLFGSRLEKYKYKPLPCGARKFRLARLLPPKPCLMPGLEPTLRVALIECEAHSSSNTTANAVEEYDTLSYAWDVPPHVKRPKRRIIVEGANNESFYIDIHRPLEVALLSLAAAHAKDQSRYGLPLFIDQICIDQENDGEKAQQVPLMQDIYTHCRCAIVWLGSATKESDLWFDYVRGLSSEGILSGMMGPRVASIMRVFDAIMEPASVTLTDADEIQDRDDLLDLVARYAHHYPIASYLSVLQRKWVTRLWTVQEACLAPSVQFVCGDRALCFDCFRQGMFFYNVQNNVWLRKINTPLYQSELQLRSSVFGATRGFTGLWQERKAIHKDNRRQSMHSLILKFNVRADDDFEEGWRIGATLAQDRIYGLLGLTDANDPIKNRLGIYYDNKNQSAMQVKAYTEAAGLMLEQGHIDVLLFNQAPKVTEGLPSWVPDWAMDITVPIGWETLQKPLFSAGGPQEGVTVQWDATKGSLVLNGVLVARIAAVGTATYTTRRETLLQPQIEYGNAKVMFDEVENFVKLAASSKATPTADEQLPAETLASTSLRVCDSGLTIQHLTEQFNDPVAGIQRLALLHDHISKLGQRLLNASATARAYSLRNIYATIGITPWYLDYYRATTILRHLARGPVPLARTIVLALADALEDVVGMCLAAARVSLATLRIALGRRFGKVDFRQGQALRNLGLDPEIAGSKEMLAFLTNLKRNAGRKVYRTGEGGWFVGLGPGGMEEGDAVVVLKGASMPLVMRRAGGRDGSGTEEWMLVGEAYCDGVMNGEALGGVERQFVLI